MRAPACTIHIRDVLARGIDETHSGLPHDSFPSITANSIYYHWRYVYAIRFLIPGLLVPYRFASLNYLSEVWSRMNG